MKAWVISYAVLAIGCLSLGFVLGEKSSEYSNSVAHHERQLSPHEQQPEPIPAVMQGGFDVERWIL